MNGSKTIYNLYAAKKDLLQKSILNFSSSTSTLAKVGVELEFYVLAADQQNQGFAANQPCIPNQNQLENYLAELQKIFSNPQNNLIYKIETEQGAAQLEAKFAHGADLLKLCDEIENFKIVAGEIAAQNNLVACFAAQPFVDDCGCAMQFNFSLHDVENDQNLFNEKNNLFLATIAGMLDSTQKAMIFFAPDEKDYLRFDQKNNENLHKKGKYCAPTNISFGDDNRTTAIRVPAKKSAQKSAQQNDCRIEFRVPSANAQPHLSLKFLLDEIADAIFQNKAPQQEQKIYGNAFEAQYKLKKLPQNLQEAHENFLKFYS